MIKKYYLSFLSAFTLTIVTLSQDLVHTL